MVYNIRSLAKVYAQGQADFMKRRRLNSWREEDAYSLFAYAMDRIYNLDSSNYSAKVCKYGDTCVTQLAGLPKTPHHIDKIRLEDRVAVVSLAKAYFLLLYKGIKITSSDLLDGGFNTGTFDIEEDIE